MSLSFAVVPIMIALIFGGAPALASAEASTITPDATGLKAAGDVAKLTAKCEGSACLVSIASTAINILFGLVGIMLFVLFLYAGVLWMTAGGSVDRVKQARVTIINAIVGLIIVVVAYSVTFFVVKALNQAYAPAPVPAAPAPAPPK